MIKKTKGSEALLIPLVFLLFSLGGAVFGMGEEAIPFAMIPVSYTHLDVYKRQAFYFISL